MTSFHRKGAYLLSAKLRKVRLDFKARSVWSQGPGAHTGYSMLPSNVPLDNTQRGSSPNPMRFSDITPNEGRADPSEETKRQMTSFCHSKRRNHRKVEAYGWRMGRSSFLSQVYTKTEARDQWLALGNTQSLLSPHPTLGAGVETLSPRAKA